MQEKRKLVSICTIENITPIEGADKIELAQIGGWQAVVKKDEFKIGDEVFYAEIDSMLPLEDSRFASFAVHNKKMQDGILYHRVKTVKLRGQISQGIIFPLSIWNPEDGDLEKIKSETNSFAEYFKIVKYEEPVKLSGNQKLTNWPDGLTKTDEERLQSLVKDWKYQDILDEGGWVATEKIDGSSITMFCEYDADNNEIGPMRVCSRNFELVRTDEDPYWKVASKKTIERTLDTGEKYSLSLEEWLQEKCNVIVNKAVYGICLQGELFGEGIQSNRLGCKGQHIRFYNLLVKYEEGWTRLPLLQVLKHYPELVKYWVPIHSELELPQTVEEAIKQPDGIHSIVPEADKNRQIEGIVWRMYDRTTIKNERIKEINWNKIPKEKWNLVKEKSTQLETKIASFKCISNKYLLKNE